MVTEPYDAHGREVEVTIGGADLYVTRVRVGDQVEEVGVRGNYQVRAQCFTDQIKMSLNTIERCLRASLCFLVEPSWSISHWEKAGDLVLQ